MKPFEESVDDWDVLGCADVVHTQVPESKPQNRLPGLILNQVEKTFNMVQRALNLVEEQQPPICDYPPRTPLTDAEFRNFLDPVGQVVRSRDLRMAIYYGGIEPSLRYVSWLETGNTNWIALSADTKCCVTSQKTVLCMLLLLLFVLRQACLEQDYASLCFQISFLLFPFLLTSLFTFILSLFISYALPGVVCIHYRSEVSYVYAQGSTSGYGE
jgi:hypothetical protein